MILTYHSPAEMARDAMARATGAESWRNSNNAWAGPNYTGINAMLEAGGEESDVPAAEKLLEKFAMEFPETERAYFAPSVAGAYPCVPDAISGLPESMRAKVSETNNGAPIKLGIVVSVSAGISPEVFQKRSAAILAILMHLNNTGRAVELWGIHTLHGRDNGETIVAVKIPSVPLSLAECNMALGNLAFARRIPFALGEAINGFNGEWAVGFSVSDMGKSFTADLAKRLGFQMILPPLHADEAKQIGADASKWMLSKYTAIQAQIESEA